MEWTNNALGRKIPTAIDGKPCLPFQGAFADSGKGRPKAAPPDRTCRAITPRQKPDKRVADWDELFDRLELRDGARISFHHHLRNGDKIVNEVVARLAARGLRDLTIRSLGAFSRARRTVALYQGGCRHEDRRGR